MKSAIANVNVRRGALGALIGLVFGGLFAWLEAANVPILERWDLALVDARMRYLAEPERTSSEITVLVIDAPTRQVLADSGVSFPPPRWFWQQLIDTLSRLEARLVVLDFTFVDRTQAPSDTWSPFAVPPAREGTDPEDHLRRLASFMTSKAIAQSAARTGIVVIGLHALDVGPESLANARAFGGWHPEVTPYFEEKILPHDADARNAVEFLAHSSGATPVLQLPEANILAGVRALGFVNVEHAVDPDLVLRRFAPLVLVDGHQIAELPVAAYAAAATTSGEMTSADYASKPPLGSRPPLPGVVVEPRKATIADAEIPLRDDGTAWIHWRGRWETDMADRLHSAAPLVLYNEAIELGEIPESVDAARFKKKIVLVGFTAQGETSDVWGTPFGTQPGVFRHAAILDTLLTKDFLRSPPGWVERLAIVLAAMATGAFVIGLPVFAWQAREGAVGQVILVVWKVLPGAVLMSAWGAASVFAFDRGVVIRIIHPELAMALATLFSTLFAYVFIRGEREEEQRRKEQALAVARGALSSDVVDSILAKNPEGSIELGGKRVPLTLYFSDIAGFTSISEKLAPEELVAILNDYLSRVTDVLVRHGAYIDKYIGDAVMAFWGAPTPDPDAPVRACLAALDARNEIERFSVELVARGLPPLKTRIGINTGQAIAGAVGHPQKKFNYTAMGDTVNLASRLEGANKAYGTTCMIGPETYAAAKHAIVARELDLVKVKGKAIPVHVYELIGRASEPLEREREIIRRYEAALLLFRAREFEQARAGFRALFEETRDTPSKTLADACDERITDPPPADWDGSNELHEK